MPECEFKDEDIEEVLPIIRSTLVYVNGDGKICQSAEMGEIRQHLMCDADLGNLAEYSLSGSLAVLQENVIMHQQGNNPNFKIPENELEFLQSTQKFIIDHKYYSDAAVRKFQSGKEENIRTVNDFIRDIIDGRRVNRSLERLLLLDSWDPSPLIG